MKQAKRQLAGSGGAMPAGSVGEVIVPSSFTISNGNTTFSNTLSIPITAGVWLITVTADQVSGAGTAGSFSIASTNIAGSVSAANFEPEIWIRRDNTARVQSVSGFCVYSTSSSLTTFSGNCGNSMGADVTVQLTAVRIA